MSKTIHRPRTKPRVELLCSRCSAALLVETVHAFLDMGWPGEAPAILRRVQERAGRQAVLTFCGVCWRFGLPAEAVHS